MSPQKNKSPDSQEIRKDRAILGLAQHSSADAVVEAERVLRQARLEAFLCSMARLQHAASTAVATLVSIMNDPHAPAGSRVRAAECVLSSMQKGLELEDLEAQVAELEASAPKDNLAAAKELKPWQT